MPTKQEIERLAYFLWEQEGRPDGRDVFHYAEAERVLKERSSAQANGGFSTKLLTDPARPAVAAAPAAQTQPPTKAPQANSQPNTVGNKNAPSKGPRKPGSKR